MNLERLINMVVNQLVRRVVNSVVNHGFSFASRKAKSLNDMKTPADHEAHEKAKELAERAGSIPRINDQFRG